MSRSRASSSTASRSNPAATSSTAWWAAGNSTSPSSRPPNTSACFGAGDCPFAAIPVFPSRVFRHGYIFVNTRAGIRTPKDLEGRRVGLPLYTQTAAIWARGHLQHQFGVDLSTIRWVQGAVEKAGTHGSPHAPPLLAPVRIEQNHGGEPLGELLGARRDRCADRIAQAGILRPPSRRRPPVSRLPRARARALSDDQDFSDHASHRVPARSL